MATYEYNGLLTVKDATGNKYLLYPITKSECVDGLEESLAAKQATITGGASTITTSNLTASRALISNGSGKVAASAVTSTELGYLDGVTSAIQTQLNAKQAKITGGASTITTSNLTASRALMSDASGKVAISPVTSTELGYLGGVTSAIQTQLNGKAASSHNHNYLPSAGGLMTGSITTTYGTARMFTNIAAYDSLQSSVTGAIKIICPLPADNDMLYVRIMVYDYVTNASSEVIVFGYAYASTPSWMNATVYISNTSIVGNVRLAYETSTKKPVILLGTESTAWKNPIVWITDLGAGFTANTAWRTGWSISLTTSVTDLSNIITPDINSGLRSASATKLATARTIALSGGATGTATSFNGTANITIPVTALDPTKLSAAVAINKGGTGATTAAAALTNLGLTATAAELNYCDGVTSAIQTQLNGKAAASHTHSYAGSSSAGGAATSAAKLTTARTISLTGDTTGSVSFDGTANASIATTLKASGVTAASYGPSANVSPAHGGTFTVPHVTVDSKGRVTDAATRTITLPADANTDTKVTQTVTTTSAEYPILAGVTANATATATTTTRFGTGITLNPSTKAITATTFKGSLSGNASTATKWATARTLTVGGTGKTVDGTANAAWTLNEIGAAPGKTISATTAATAGWYRIATSPLGISRCIGTFTVRATVSGKHSVVTFLAGITYGQGPILVQLGASQYSSVAISKIRLVYHTTYSDNYAYIEVYNPAASAIGIHVTMSDAYEWTLVEPSTVGSIPSGYTNKELAIVSGALATTTFNGALSGNASTATKLATARTIALSGGATGTATSFNGTANITIPVTALDPTKLSAAVPVNKGGTGAATAAAARTALGVAATSHTHNAADITAGSFSVGRKVSTTIGTTSIAIGNNATASGNYSQAYGDSTIAGCRILKTINSESEMAATANPGDGYKIGTNGNYKGISIGAGLYIVCIKNNGSSNGDWDAVHRIGCEHAEGVECIAAGEGAHAEGSETIASGVGAHAEGSGTMSVSLQSHAEGSNSKATGSASHAEGGRTTASGNSSHSEGIITVASGSASHSEGDNTTSSGNATHAEGYYTTASNFASHAGGKCNKMMTDGGAENNTVGDVFVLGNGTGITSKSNAFRVTYAGKVYGLSSFNSSGADYSEFFEWEDGNPNNEDRVGYFVTMNSKYINKANSSDDFITGVTSGNPCIIGNADEDWLGRWEKDKFNRFIKEDALETVKELREVETGEYRTKMDPETGEEIQVPVTELREVPTGEKVVNGWKYKANPDYDPSQPYIPREDRPEWSTVCMIGVIPVRDDGTCIVNGYCKPSAGGIATKSDSKADSYRVLRRVDTDVVEILFK